MKLRLTLLASCMGVLPLTMLTPAHAVQLMGEPLAMATSQEKNALLGKLDASRSERGLDADHGFTLAAQHPGVPGTKVTRAVHTYKGLRVFGSESVVVTDSAGNVLTESVSDRRAGLGSNSGGASALSAAAGGNVPPGVDLDVTPALDQQNAIEAAELATAPRALERHAASAELLIYPVMRTQRVASAMNKPEARLNALDVEEVVDHHELAYLVKTRVLVDDRPAATDTIISATDGRVLAQWNALQEVIGVGNSQYNGQVPISTTLSGSTYTMKDTTRGTGGTYGGMAITNANHSTTSAGSIYSSTSNTWGDGANYVSGASTTGANGQTAAVNAMWGLMNTYDTLKNVVGWNSLDGNNTATYIAAHYSTAYDNAFYDDSCACMYIGDGSSFYSLGAIDVMGHEMHHGVTAATSNLTYSGESGGLNESASDIGGEAVEAYARNGGTGSVIPNSGNDWQIGTEISKTGTPLRYMYKPSKDGSSPNAWSSTIKNLDVHYSSGPNNRMFYFLAKGSSATTSSDYYSSYLTQAPLAMTGIGTDKAYRIWFKALTTTFTASTNYADARTKVIAAAVALYGSGSAEAIAAQRAYAAINVGADIAESGAGGGAVAISSQPASVTVAAGATATFAVAASGGTAPYTYKWYRGSTVISGATAASYSLVTASADSGAVFHATVTDSSATPVTVTSGNATLTVSSGGGASTEKVLNGGFESGATSWSGSTGVIGTFTGQSAYEGTKYAYLGGNGTTASETLTQAVAIPSTATSAALTFALHIDTAETTTSTIYDKLVVTVKNSAGTVLGTLATYSNLNKATGYQIRSFSLLPYKGQTVTLSFAMTEDSSAQTSFVLDKVSLLTQ